jgi:hypothetical protein
LLGFAYVRNALSSSTFSLGEALSEEAALSVMEKDAMGNKIPKLSADGKPLVATVLVGSTSRVIALAGSIMLLLLFMGFGVFVLYYFALGQGVPKDINKVVTFLLSGLTLFAPYLVNKFSSLFDGMGLK